MAAPQGFLTLVATRIQDAGGNPLNGSVVIETTDSLDQPMPPPVAGGIGGAIVAPVEFDFVNGALPAGACFLPVSNLTTNPNQCFRFTFKDTDGEVLGQWTGVQPTGSSFSLDTYQPPLSGPQFIQVPGTPGAPGAPGAPGLPGAPGAAGLAGSVTASGPNGDWIVPGVSREQASVTIPTGPSNTPSNNIQNPANVSFYGSGWNRGNVSGLPNTSLWSVLKSQDRSITSFVRGINQGMGMTLEGRSIGDKGAIYAYANGVGGVVAQSDEGQTAISAQSVEYHDHYKGFLGSTSGPGDRQPVPGPTNSQVDWIADGTPLINISKGTISGKMTGPNVAQGTNGLYHVPTDAALPKCSAWGTLVSCSTQATTSYIPDPYTTMDVNTPVQITVQLQQIDGALQPFAPGLVMVAGMNFPEQALVSNPQPPAADGTQVLTIALRNPNTSATIFQGGCAGQFISFDAQLALYALLGRAYKRTAYYCFGSIDGVHLICGKYIGASRVPGSCQIPVEGAEAGSTSDPTRSGFHLYPGAEVVARHDDHYSLTLEPNGVSWAAGDQIENPHGTAFKNNAAYFVAEQYTPTDVQLGSNALRVAAVGPGVTQRFSPAAISNDSDPRQYTANGGPLSCPVAIFLDGPFAGAIRMGQAPIATDIYSTLGTLFTVSTAANNFRLFDLPLNGGHSYFDYNSSTGVYDCERFGATAASVSGLVITNRNGLGDYSHPTRSRSGLLHYESGPLESFCNTGDGLLVGAFHTQNFATHQMGFYNDQGAGNFGVVGAGQQRAMFGFDLTGWVGTLRNTQTYDGPIKANTLDDGNGNAIFQGSVTVGSILMADTTNGHTYKLQMVNGVLTPTQVS